MVSRPISRLKAEKMVTIRNPARYVLVFVFRKITTDTDPSGAEENRTTLSVWLR